MSQPDTIVPDPGNSQAWDRYAYALNNPLRYNDPTGHYGEDVHYTLTWQIAYQEAFLYARQEGGTGLTRDEADAFAREFATEVAQADLDVDNVGKHPEENPLLRPPVNGYVQHHFYSRRGAQQALDNAETTEEFGTAMHSYQDSFSHWEKLKQPSTPQAIWDGHKKNQEERISCLIENIKGTCNYKSDVSIDTYAPEKRQIDRDMRDSTRAQIRDFLSRQFVP